MPVVIAVAAVAAGMGLPSAAGRAASIAPTPEPAIMSCANPVSTRPK
ncbi:hypothetical protein C1Y40_05545 [Mycobacterium talmoniae]|uniref:Uncharacterized protein n=1 Tax=Mycobacterium talmoniae TaxID=1858794 RepID=A0A2S8BCC6_9MYCO|nr:hypothetical protein C1Y40_05545 [Mycobacterium talmoniae]